MKKICLIIVGIFICSALFSQQQNQLISIVSPLKDTLLVGLSNKLKIDLPKEYKKEKLKVTCNGNAKVETPDSTGTYIVNVYGNETTVMVMVSYDGKPYAKKDFKPTIITNDIFKRINNIFIK